MSVSFTPELKKMLVKLGATLKGKVRETMKFGIVQLQTVVL
jgi:hypothetical protein